MIIPPMLSIIKATQTNEPETLFKKGTVTFEDKAQRIGINAIRCHNCFNNFCKPIDSTIFAKFIQSS